MKKTKLSQKGERIIIAGKSGGGGLCSALGKSFIGLILRPASCVMDSSAPGTLSAHCPSPPEVQSTNLFTSLMKVLYTRDGVEARTSGSACNVISE